MGVVVGVVVMIDGVSPLELLGTSAREGPVDKGPFTGPGDPGEIALAKSMIFEKSFP